QQPHAEERAARASRSMGSKRLTHLIVNTRHPKADAVLASNQNIENNPMQSNKGSPAWMLCPRRHFDTSGKSPALLQYRVTQDRSWPRGF
ncbi:MAG: hypothetical protein WAV72_00050, partial [Bradyrhizobium sp.]